MIRWPSIIEQDKANHYVRGSQIGALAGGGAAVLSYICGTGYDGGLQGQTLLGTALLFGAIQSTLAAALAGWAVERLQQTENDALVDAGGDPIHHIERADIWWTAYGGATVATPMLATGIVILAG